MKGLDEINDLKMEILEAMIENKNNEEEIEQWTENHRAAVAIYDAPIEENRQQNREIQKKVTAIAKVIRLNKLRVNVCTVKNLAIDLVIVKLQKP